MVTFKKISMPFFILSLSIINLTIAMERSQLQLQNSTKHNEPVQINCSIGVFISPKNSSIVYACKEHHDEILKYHHLHSTIKDPIISLKITDNDNSDKIHIAHVPIKKCANLSNGATLYIHEANGAIFDSTYANNQPLIFKGTCTTTFNEDLNVAKNKFYINPSVHISANNQEELTNEGIFTINPAIKSSYPNIKGTCTRGGINRAYTPHWMKIFSNRNRSQSFYVDVVEGLVGHGPNDCQDEQAYIKSIIDDEILTDKNVFTYLKNRERSSNR